MDRTDELLTEIDNARAAKAAASERLSEALQHAARYLVHDLGLTVRDAGHELGVSHQRVCQLLLDADGCRREVA